LDGLDSGLWRNRDSPLPDGADRLRSNL